MSVKYEGCSNLCVFLFLICIFCYLIILLAIFGAEIQLYQNFEDSKNIYSSDQIKSFVLGSQDASEKSSLHPIISLTLTESNSNCSNGTEILSLYSWNTQEICVCPYNSQFSSGSCPNYTQTNCYTTGERQLSLFNWKGAHFCVKRNSEWYQKDSGSVCSSDYISCANNICMKKSNISVGTNSTDEFCPITKILIAKNQSNESLTNSSYKYNFISNFSDNSSLYVSKAYEGDFITSLQVEINGKPCVYPLEAPVRSEFQLLKAKPNGCQAYGSDKNIYSEVDSQIEWDLYTQNQLQKLTSDIKNIQTFAGNTAYIYTVTRPKMSCSPKFKVLLDDPMIVTLNTIRKGGDTLGLVFIVITLILLFVHTYYMFKLGNYTDSLVLAFLIIFIVFIQGIVCPISLYYVSTHLMNNSYIDEIKRNNCFKYEGYNNMIKDFGSSILLDTQKDFSFINTILYLSLLLFIFIMFYLMDKLKFNNFYDEEAHGTLEDSDFLKDCKIDVDDIECDCIL